MIRQYLLPPVRIAKSCCGPVGLSFTTNLSLFFFFFTCTRLLASSSLSFSLFFSSSSSYSRAAAAHRTSPMPATGISVSLVNVNAIFHIVIRKCGEEWLIRQLLYPNGNFSDCSGSLTVRFVRTVLPNFYEWPSRIDSRKFGEFDPYHVYGAWQFGGVRDGTRGLCRTARIISFGLKYIHCVS